MAREQPINEAIRAREVLLLDEDGSDLGIVARDDALALARTRKLDLVQLDTASSPPRCRLTDAQAAQAQGTRQARAARAAEAPPKELRLRTATGTHDIATQARRASGLLAAGHSVKVIVLLEKSERGNTAAARALLETITRDLSPAGRPEGKPTQEKGALTILVRPSGPVVY